MDIHWLLKGSCWPINILLFVSTLENVRLKSFSLNKPVKFEYKRRLCISLFHTSVDFGNENVRKSIIFGIGVATISGPHKHVFGLCCTCLCFFHIVSPVSVVLIVCFWIRIVLFYFHLSPLTYTPWYGVHLSPLTYTPWYGVHLSPLTYTPWYGACMSCFYFSVLYYCILLILLLTMYLYTVWSITSSDASYLYHIKKHERFIYELFIGSNGQTYTLSMKLLNSNC